MLAGRDPGQLLIRQTVEVDRGERPAALDALAIFVRSQGLQEENEKDAEYSRTWVDARLNQWYVGRRRAPEMPASGLRPRRLDFRDILLSERLMDRRDFSILTTAPELPGTVTLGTTESAYADRRKGQDARRCEAR